MAGTRSSDGTAYTRLLLQRVQVLGIGATGLAIVLGLLVVTFIVTKWIGTLMGVDPKLAELIAAGTSICGASAVARSSS